MLTLLVTLAVAVSIVTCAPTRPGRPHHFKGQPISTTVDLGYSKYQGLDLEPAGVKQWLGIRFAAPPTGDLRWRAPQEPPLNNSEVLPATQFGATCIGYWIETLSDIVNEDCLYLDVFAPANVTTESNLPGNKVQINYRVGVYGFLASETIRGNGDLNVGLLDQRFALHWVQNYIHLFGGNREHVVIHGDSAGAGSVAYHMTAYGGRNDNLFVGGMAESEFWPTHRTVPEMEFQFDEFAANVSCSATEAPNGDVLACLRSKDTVTLQSADHQGTFPDASGVAEWWFLPVVDGTFSTDYLYNLFEQGKVVPVPLLVGDDTDEGTGFAPNATNSTEFMTFIKSNFPKLSEADLQLINETYPEDGFGTFPNHAAYFAATETAYGENTFICPGIEMSNSLSTFNSPAEVWNYRYNVQDQQNIAAGLGVPHVSEKPAIWGVNNTGPCDGCSYETYNAAIVPVMMSYWLSFVVSLNPNTHKDPSAPYWAPWVAGSEGYGNGTDEVQRIVIETNATRMETVPSAQLKRCEFWLSLANVTEQ
ncbi:hypothetical protein LTR08_002575 [Meristemomyces frigidus]|nr:hypothetical protein LTR08_002575 [Meristemomyces frigidus]